MQTAAMTSRFITGSSKAGFTDSEIVVSHAGFIQHFVVSHLTQAVHSREVFLKLTNALIHSAEQALVMRDLASLQNASGVLINLPIDCAHQIGLYYHALAINRIGQTDEAESLLETIADNASATYRARAIQALGANHHDKGQLDEALRFQLEALRMASDKKADGLLTTLIAHHEISVIHSLNGDHKSAFSRLERLSPLVSRVAKEKPFYFYAHCNELAIELGELGRTAEAKAVSEIALASPYAPAYPNWAETRQELDAKRASATPSVVAINRAPNADLARQSKASPQAEPKRRRKPSKLFAFHCLTSKKDSFQRSAIQFPATATIALNAISILDRALICTGPRAPPALSRIQPR